MKNLVCTVYYCAVPNHMVCRVLPDPGSDILNSGENG